MVQQMLDKFCEYKSVSAMSPMPAGDKQQPTTVKKVALKELSNESGNIINRPPTSSVLNKEKKQSDPVKVISPESVKLSGTKRQQQEGASSPPNYQPPSKTGINGNLVYVRRKLETEQAKACGCTNTNNAVSPGSRKQSGAKSIIHSMQQSQNQDNKAASCPRHTPATVNLLASSPKPQSASHSDEKPFTGLALPETSQSATAGTSAVGINDVDNQDWKDRFIRLQMFLKSCDQSGQEDYVQMLRSLSAAGRSMHAVELEKRAIHLLLEEGKELNRMKILNVLGKTSTNNSPILSQAASLEPQFPEMRKPVDNH